MSEQDTPEEFRSWLRFGVKWRDSGEKIYCTGDATGSRHRPALMRVERVSPADWSREGGYYIIDLRCPQCKHQHTVSAPIDRLAPCGEDADPAFPIRAEAPLQLLGRAMAHGYTLGRGQFCNAFGQWNESQDRFYYLERMNPQNFVEAPFDDVRERDYLEHLIQSMDADNVLACFAIISAAMHAYLRRDDYVLIDLYDMAVHTGLIRNRKDNVTDSLRKIWDTVQALSRYQVKYDMPPQKTRDPRGVPMETYRWGTVLDVEFRDRPSPHVLQLTIYDRARVPKAVAVRVRKHWAQMLTPGETAWLVAGGDVLAKFPPRRAQGAWARVIGITLLSQFLRRKGPVCLERQFVLKYIPPARSNVDALLSDHRTRQRAQRYWDGAMQLLVKTGILAQPPEGDAPLDDNPERWMRCRLTFRPGHFVTNAMRVKVDALHETARSVHETARSVHETARSVHETVHHNDGKPTQKMKKKHER